MRKFCKNRMFISVLFSVVLTFVFVFVTVYASTTIGTNLSTGGNLTVTGTAGVTGLTTLVNASSTMISTLSTGYLWVGGYATTTGSNGNIATEGTLTVKGLSYFLGGATTTTLTLLNGEQISNATDGTITLTAATTTTTGLGLFTTGFLSQASSTVFGDLTVSGTFTPTQTAATTFAVGGGYAAGGSGSTLDANGKVQLNSDLEVNGKATTTASSGAIATQSTLTVTSLATFLGGATTTILTLLNGEEISNAVDGVIQLAGIASTTSLTLLNGEQITNAVDGTIVSSGALAVGSDGAGQNVTFYTDDAGEEFSWNATANQLALDGANGTVVLDVTDGNVQIADVASTTQLIVGGSSNYGTVSGIVFGYCNIAATDVAASSTTGVICASANGIRTGDKIFIQATSSLPNNFVLKGASSTVANTIGVDIHNIGYTETISTGINSFNFIGIR